MVKLDKIWLSKTGYQIENGTENASKKNSLFTLGIINITTKFLKTVLTHSLFIKRINNLQTEQF